MNERGSLHVVLGTDPLGLAVARYLRHDGTHAAAFRALHQYLGVDIGEHLGYLFTGLWSLLIGMGLIQTALPTWLGWPGIFIGIGLVIGSGEFLGPNEEHGWSLAGFAIPILYIALSVWLLAMGIALVA